MLSKGFLNLLGSQVWSHLKFCIALTWHSFVIYDSIQKKVLGGYQ